MDHSRINMIVERFEAGSLRPSELTHQAHLIIAIVYARLYGATAEQMFKRALQRYVRVWTGNLGGYHETMTIAWMRLVAAFSEDTVELDLPDAVVRLCEFYPDKKALDVHYSRERLMSPAARAEWIQPDREALPTTRMNRLGTNEAKSTC